MRLIDGDELLRRYPECRDLRRKVDEMPTVILHQCQTLGREKVQITLGEPIALETKTLEEWGRNL